MRDNVPKWLVNSGLLIFGVCVGSSALFSRDMQNSPSAGVQERRDLRQPAERFIGHVVSCDGAHATVAATINSIEEAEADLWSVGRLVTILVGENRVIALTRSMKTSSAHWVENAANGFRVDLELLGEIRVFPDGREQFSTGISTYPYLGARAHQIRSSDLVKIYDRGTMETSVIGRLSQDDTIDAAVHVPSMLSKHFSLVGSTGAGKSTAVSLLMNKAIESDPKLRILILDPHNEFAAAFPGKAVVIDTDSLDLPFWVFRLDEFAEVLYRGRPAIADELDVLRDLIPEAKRAFRGSEGTSPRRQSERASFTADTPVPYRVADLLALIDERIGKLEGTIRKALSARPETAPRRSGERSALPLHVHLEHDQRHDQRDHLPYLPYPGRRPADRDAAARRNPLGSRQFRRLGAVPHGVRNIALVERRRPHSRRLRRSPPLRPVRSQSRLLPDPPGHRPDRQGRPQIRLLARDHHPASGRTRPDDPVAVLDHLRDASLPTKSTRISSARPFPARRLRR